MSIIIAINYRYQVLAPHEIIISPFRQEKEKRGRRRRGGKERFTYFPAPFSGTVKDVSSSSIIYLACIACLPACLSGRGRYCAVLHCPVDAVGR